MSLHRPSNLMGLAACHEAGKRRSSPIAPGARPLTAEERAAIRKRHDQRPLYQMLADATRCATLPLARSAFADMAEYINKARDDMARSMDMSHYIVGIDMAKPGNDVTVVLRRQERPDAYYERQKALDRAKGD